jgi:hypothetical protein
MVDVCQRRRGYEGPCRTGIAKLGHLINGTTNKLGIDMDGFRGYRLSLGEIWSTIRTYLIESQIKLRRNVEVVFSRPVRSSARGFSGITRCKSL